LRDRKVGACGGVDFYAGGPGSGEDLGGGYGKGVDVDRVGYRIDEFVDVECGKWESILPWSIMWDVRYCFD
jgi:hypothetical protein